jgi:hypothetical protein
VVAAPPSGAPASPLAGECDHAQLAQLQLQLQALQESNDAAKAEAEGWRTSASWLRRGGVLLLVSLAAALLLRRFRRP